MVFDITLIIIAALTAAIIIHSTVTLGISPMPSSKKACLGMMQLTEQTGKGNIVDLGSGWGNIVIRIARKYPNRKVAGYELSILPWFVSILLKKIFCLNNLTIYRQDYNLANLSNTSVLVCYLYPQAMIALENKLRTQELAIDFVISNNFSLPSYQAQTLLKLDDIYNSPIYLYKIRPI